jgi:hypothetical protein
MGQVPHSENLLSLKIQIFQKGLAKLMDDTVLLFWQYWGLRSVTDACWTGVLT